MSSSPPKLSVWNVMDLGNPSLQIISQCVIMNWRMWNLDSSKLGSNYPRMRYYIVAKFLIQWEENCSIGIVDRCISLDSMSLHLIQFKWNTISDMLSSYSIICWDSYPSFVAHQFRLAFVTYEFTFVLIVFYLQKQESSHLFAKEFKMMQKKKIYGFLTKKEAGNFK